MKIYKVSQNAYEYYIHNVKDNENASYDLVCRKLTRNIMLGKKMPDKENKRLYFYGNLAILIRNGEIVWLNNYKDKYHNFTVDKAKYDKLNRKLGITENNNIGFLHICLNKLKTVFNN